MSIIVSREIYFFSCYSFFHRVQIPGSFYELNVHFGVFVGGMGDFSEIFLGNQVQLFFRIFKQDSHIICFFNRRTSAAAWRTSGLTGLTSWKEHG